MSKLGIHFPNAGFRNLDALWSIPWESFVILHLNREWVPEIRLRFPKATILVRAYLKDWTTADPVEWAREISQWANQLRSYNIEITFANEQNLAAEGHPLGARPGIDYPPASVYRDILHWDMAVIRELRAEVPWAVIHFPALSQGHSDDQGDAGYVGFEILRKAVQMCEVLDAHIYWDERKPGQRQDLHYGERYRLLHSLFPDKPIFISECGSNWSDTGEAGQAVALWLKRLPDYVTGACWFIWDSDAENRPWILRDMPLIVEAMRSHQLASAVPSGPQSIVNPIDIATALVIGWIGFNATAYVTSSGQQTIGYGHLIRLIRQNDGSRHSISEPEARELLHHDLELCLQALDQVVKVPLSANQKAALISFVYDVGIDELQGSALLQRVAFADHVGAALALRDWRRSDGRHSPESIRRRQIESQLFLRDVMTPVPVAATAPMSPPPTVPLLCTISTTATWVSVRQGERYQVIGVWYYEDGSPTVSNVKDDPDELKNGGRIRVKVEDESGTGIPAELVVRRWDNPDGECEPRLSDASGVARFELAADSRFDPSHTRGPDRIQVGDCVVSGLGIPSYGTGGEGQVVHVIRIRKAV
jgi:lysozyme